MNEARLVILDVCSGFWGRAASICCPLHDSTAGGLKRLIKRPCWTESVDSLHMCAVNQSSSQLLHHSPAGSPLKGLCFICTLAPCKKSPNPGAGSDSPSGPQQRSSCRKGGKRSPEADQEMTHSSGMLPRKLPMFWFCSQNRGWQADGGKAARFCLKDTLCC